MAFLSAPVYATPVAILDGSGNQVTTFGGSGGTAQADASTFTRGTSSETPVAGVVEASSPSLTAGKSAALSLDTSGNLRVNVVAGAGSGGTALADNATFTRGTTSETPAGGVVETANPSLTAGKASALSLDTSGNLRVVASNSITAGTAGTPSSQVLSIQGISGGVPTETANSPYLLVSAATTNGTSVTTVAGYVRVASAINNSATNWAYLKIYDKASAPTVGTDTPVAVFGLPPNGGSNPAGVIKLSNGLAIAVTGGAANSDTTAVAAAQNVVTLLHT